MEQNGWLERTEGKSNVANDRRKFKQKIFVARKSLLDDVLEVKQIRTLHNIFLFFLLALFVEQFSAGLINNRKASLHIDIVYKNFGDGFRAILGWLLLFASVLITYPAFSLWLSVRKMSPSEAASRTWNTISMSAVFAFYYTTFRWVGNYVESENLSYTSSFSLCVETCRLLMKAHAFLRGNAALLAQRGIQGYELPTFRHFLEFLFFPTLIYSEVYPRTKTIKCRRICSLACELCAIIVFLAYLHNIFFLPDCTYFKTAPEITTMRYVHLIFRNTIPSLISMSLIFYFLLHAWMNLFSELTRFADRQFYEVLCLQLYSALVINRVGFQDWWNATSYDEYYRKWNIVVHDWLYNYVLRDAYEILALKNILIAKFLVFLASALAHEYVIYYSTGMFYPLLAIVFLLSAMIFMLFRLPSHWSVNVLFLYGHSLGFSFLFTTYEVENCVRQNPCSFNSTKVPFEWLYSHTLFSDCVQ